MEVDFLTQVVLPLSLFLIMLGMGLSLTAADFTHVLKDPKAVAIGVVCQMIMLPVMGFVVAKVFSLSPELAVGLMILAFCPGGATSNMITYLSRGDVALSISLTAVVSLVTPFTIPLLTAFMMTMLMDQSQAFSIPIVKTILQLIVISIVPVAIGMIIHNKFPVFSARAEKPVKVFSVLILFIIIAGIVAKNWDNMAGFFVQTGAASLSLNILTLTLGYWTAKLCRLEKREAISIGIEVGIQNGTLALLVAGTLLGNTVMTIPAVTYSLLMFITGGVFGWLVNQRSKWGINEPIDFKRSS
ncbi:bile acid:sodium symporter family protein [Spartinivicinus poritis]|uniref:Bile acid:sodium symporter family protein n=1 Tax=Spartinivicinus poritis TaxID=2994640 RepID=A0ABT5U6J2_9GAMM|nr:bile acid:sodium symporter family protein [Spartinivicinus sp. A2-2]MDE1461172.1 bile acid:sodium symporter family protein [Spartinivicinus sp. A2-2]